jgi:hypothetical protein
MYIFICTHAHAHTIHTYREWVDKARSSIPEVVKGLLPDELKGASIELAPYLADRCVACIHVYVCIYVYMYVCKYMHVYMYMYDTHIYGQMG